MSRRTERGPVLVPLLVLMAVWLPAAAWGGYAIAHLWRWFVMPIGVHASLSVWQAAGVAVLTRLLTFDSTIARNAAERSMWETAGYEITLAAFLPAFALGAGALYHALAG